MSDKLRDALAELVAAISDKHYGRMPERVQTAYDAARAALAQPAECADNDSPWLVCKPCAAAGKCAKEAQPAETVREPVALLWQVRRALVLASAICDAVPNRDPGHLGVLVNAQPDGTHGYRLIHDALDALETYLTTPEAAPPAPQPQPVSTADELPTVKESLTVAPQLDALFEATNYAHTLACDLHVKHYSEVTQWRPLPDLLGLLAQIDNMATGLVRAPQPRVPLTGPWRAMIEGAPEPDTVCAVVVRYSLDRPPFVAVDEWRMHREDPTGMGGPTMEMGYCWADNDENDVLYWMPLPAIPDPCNDPRIQPSEGE